MYKQVWNKYLPIIRILIKRASTADQTLAMNATDFERASAGRKAGYKFAMRFSNGRLDDNISTTPVAKDLLSILLGDDLIKELFRQNHYQVEMSTKFQLGIKVIPKMILEEAAAVLNDEPLVEAVS